MNRITLLNNKIKSQKNDKYLKLANKYTLYIVNNFINNRKSIKVFKNR